MNRTQRWRLAWRSAFFALFVLAPPLDLFRLDLTQGHFIVLGMPWTLDIRDTTAMEASLNLLLRAFLPVALLVALGAWVAWRYGRLYCGWLCPHFSVVEMINALMRRASGRPTLWLRKPLPQAQRDGVRISPHASLWVVVALAVVGFSLLWSVTLLTYLLPPAQVWGNFFSASLSDGQLLFLIVATGVLLVEFTLARHLFCRYGCAVGLAQSLLWMGNRRALVVGFDRARAAECATCDASCEHGCPMRLQPRQIKRRKFTCTQCQRCVQACENVNRPLGRTSLLQMLDAQCALDVSARDFGRRPVTPATCFRRRLAPGGSDA